MVPHKKRNSSGWSDKRAKENLVMVVILFAFQNAFSAYQQR